MGFIAPGVVSGSGVKRRHSPVPSGPRSASYTYRRVVDRLVRAGVESPLLDAACLMEAASGIPRWRFISEREQPIASGRPDLLELMLSRREAREPIAYILGVKEFWSLSLTVCCGALIPRPETETLVEAVLEKVRVTECGDRGTPAWPLAPRPSPLAPTILDIGTGCGAIALALASEIPRARVYALDRSSGALRIARRNAEALGLTGRVHCVQGDLVEPLRTIQGGGGFDLIVSNPPYIPSDALGALPTDVAAFEPLEALDGGPDGLRYHRRIIEQAPCYLSEGGWLALEVGDGQAPAVVNLIRRTDAFGPAEVTQDLAGRDRVILAPRTARAHG